MEQFYSRLNLTTDITDETVIDESGDDDEDNNKDERLSEQTMEKRVACDEDFSESDEDGEGRRHIESHKRKKLKMDNTEKDDKREYYIILIYLILYFFVY